MGEFESIYKQFVLPQLVVMLVGSLEVYLTTVFRSYMAAKIDLKERAIADISNRYNFQNWGSSVDAFRTYLDMELCPSGLESGKVMALQQKRHVVVHRLGILDERAVKQLALDPSFIGKRLVVQASEVREGIELVRQIGEHISRASIAQKQDYE
jgi:hypothetical protein